MGAPCGLDLRGVRRIGGAGNAEVVAPGHPGAEDDADATLTSVDFNQRKSGEPARADFSPSGEDAEVLSAEC